MSEPDILTTVEHIKNARHLYITAIHTMRAYYKHSKKPTPANEKEMQRQLRLLHKALTRFNYGYDPIAVAKDYIDAKFKNNKKGAK